MNKRYFTLAEVLITLGVIGIVAAITIPSLATSINNKIKEHQTKVIEKRLIEGLNLYNTTENGLSKSFSSTYEFLQGLSKHYKMSAICDTQHLSDCFPYKKIKVIDGDKKDEIEISSMTSAKKLKLGDGYLAPAGFISASGIPYVVSWDNNCSNRYDDKDNTKTLIDPDRVLENVPVCLAGFYDYNGSRSPNRASDTQKNDDIITFNGARFQTCETGFAAVHSVPSKA